ncbi:hypothetical protein QQG74_10005 [Micromonospora sp. FIMYZ51]|uniref:hypothetical protein n=1 Tax=Micromonospora sp. FIMYZ51 TaxID=3051832 RepID=UPI00311DE0C6
MKTAFGPKSVPSGPESEWRASEAEWARIESRHTWWPVVGFGLLGALTVAAGVWLMSHGRLPWIGGGW